MPYSIITKYPFKVFTDVLANATYSKLQNLA